MVLNDKEILTQLKQGLVTGLQAPADWYGKDSPVHPHLSILASERSSYLAQKNRIIRGLPAD